MYKERICKICTRVFEPKHPNNTLCSKLCKKIAFTRTMREYMRKKTLLKKEINNVCKS